MRGKEAECIYLTAKVQQHLVSQVGPRPKAYRLVCLQIKPNEQIRPFIFLDKEKKYYICQKGQNLLLYWQIYFVMYPHKCTLKNWRKHARKCIFDSQNARAGWYNFPSLCQRNLRKKSWTGCRSQFIFFLNKSPQLFHLFLFHFSSSAVSVVSLWKFSRSKSRKKTYLIGNEACPLSVTNSKQSQQRVLVTVTNQN